MQILEDLYIGNVRPGERMFKRNSQYAKALDETVKAGDALTASLSDEQKEFFEDYMTAQREVNVLTDWRSGKRPACACKTAARPIPLQAA